jgi:hypothetical protein
MNRKKSRKGLILFFCLYIALSALIAVVLLKQREPLEQKLAVYEAAQLENQCARVFEELFAHPDWQRIYEMSNTADTPYEGAAAYDAYMVAKVKDTALTYREVYTAQPGTHRYHVYLDTEKIAAFTLTGGASSASEIPLWTLEGVEIFFERSISVTIEKKPEQTVSINGVALDDSFTIRTTATRAEGYLPEGVHGYRSEQQYIGGLLVQPQILVTDETGQSVAVELDQERGVYTTLIAAPAEMTEAEASLARNAAIADAKYAMRTITVTQLRQYFDAETQIYADIVNNPMTIQGHKRSFIDEETIEVDEFCRYSDNLFSAKVKLTVKVIRKDDTLKIYPLEKTYFFTRNESGNYLVTDYTNESVQEQVEQVRLTFAVHDEKQSVMADIGAKSVRLPEVTAPAGQMLTGWAVKSGDGETVTMTVRLLPDGVILGELEPMELYPVYEQVSE